MELEDIPAVIEIAEATGICPWSVTGFQAHLTDRTCLSLIAGHPQTARIGFLVARLVPGKGDRPDAELLNIAVKPTYQARGLGRRLMDELMDWCRSRDVDRIWLEVRVSNTKAIDLYHDYGFVTQGRCKRTYTDPVEDGFLLMCDLKENRSENSNA